MKLIRSFEKGYMNKSFNNRILPKGEYSDATNVSVSSDDQAIGLVEEADGNKRLSAIRFNGVRASLFAECIGALTDDAEETIYWFVHDPGGVNAAGATAPALDYIVSYNMVELRLVYHVVSASVLNFSLKHRINGVDKIDDLLFFTDNLNPPRKINVNRNYAFPTGSPLVDVITQDDVNVIVKPPACAPGVVPFDNGSEENFIEDKFLSFAYRYRYQDGEYSALSAFSEVAFDARKFELEGGNYDNLGMLNKYNSARVTVDTGPSRVIGFDVVFKLSDSTIINVIERVDKNKSLIADNVDYTLTFDNSKIYTVLPTGEINRIFDNVPLTAKAQTIMGNRLIYGNYEEGRDLVDVDDQPISLDYNVELNSEQVNSDEVEGVTSSFTYTSLGGGSSTATATFSIPSSRLVSGTEMAFEIAYEGDSFAGTDAPSSNHPSSVINFSFKLHRDFSSVADLVLAPDGLSTATGTGSSGSHPIVAPIASGSCDSPLGTDRYNCDIRNNNPATHTLQGTGTSAVNQPLKLEYSGSDLKITILAVQRQNISTTNVSYEYMDITRATVDLSIGQAFRSLHSNRDYDVGIVYLDEYNRSSTVLISRANTVYIPPENSITKNTLKVNIPTTQKPPKWAKSYKFFVKPSGGAYETIYSNIFYQHPETKINYFKLEGNNQTKMADDETLIIKADASGPLDVLEEATVIDIEAQERNFLQDAGLAGTQFGGLYMAMDPGGFDTSTSIEVKTQGTIKKSTDKRGVVNDNYDIPGFDDVVTGSTVWESTPYVRYPLFNVTDSSGAPADPVQVENFNVPQGARVRIEFEFRRKQKTSNKGSKLYKFDREFVSNDDYNNLYDFWVGESISNYIDDPAQFDTSSNVPTRVEYFNTVADVATVDSRTTLEPKTFATPGDEEVLSYHGFGSNVSGFNITNILDDLERSADKNLIQFYRVPASIATNAPSEDVYWLAMRSGAMGYDGIRGGNKSVAKIKIEIFTSKSTMIFETRPKDISDELYYETSQCFDIIEDAGDLFHAGNTQNQSASQKAICDLTVFNCYAFGNGAESFRVRDRTSTKEFQIGERANAVANQDYKNIRRFASLTYSGIYNEDTNLNRLNEFNLGLANFKDLEKMYGTIEVIDGRQTDILVLQEDRVSYVLAGKNLLSDAAGGGDIASIPEVLGTQIARMEEYGISKNPESYDVYGPAKFFTDVKRGSVIQINGSSYSDEQMLISSEKFMTDFFRDEFSTMGQYTQKLGGYDANIDEYILFASKKALPRDPVIQPCDYEYTEGSEQPDSAKSLTIDLGEATGTVQVNFGIDSIVRKQMEGTIKLASENKTTGQTTSTSNNKLIDNNATFTSTVAPGDQAFRGNELRPYNVNSVDSDTQLTLNVYSNSQFKANENYIIKGATEAKTVIDESKDFTTLSASLANYRLRNKTNGQEVAIDTVVSATKIVVHDPVITDGVAYDIVDTTNGSVTPTITWNGVVQGGSGAAISTSKAFSFNKTTKTPTVADLDISVPVNDLVTYRVFVPCPQNDQVEVRRFVITTPAQAGLFTDFGHGTGTGADIPYNAINSVFEVGSNNIVSHYSVIEGTKGVDPVPDDGETVTMAVLEPPSNGKPSISSPQFNFVPNGIDPAQNGHRMMFLLSATDYNATSSQADLVAMMSAAASGGGVTGGVLTPSSSALFSGTTGSFTYNNPTNLKLYLIWDLRDIFTMSLGFSSSSASNACIAGGSTYYTDSRYIIPGNTPTSIPAGVQYNPSRLAKNIWTNTDLTSAAADGFYKDLGVTQLTGHVLALVQNGVYSDRNIAMAPIIDSNNTSLYVC